MLKILKSINILKKKIKHHQKTNILSTNKNKTL